MTLQEWNSEKEVLLYKYNKKLHHLNKKFALKNFKYKPGDFIQNKTGIIKIEFITYEIIGNNIYVAYSGFRYKKVKGELLRTKSFEFCTLIFNTEKLKL